MKPCCTSLAEPEVGIHRKRKQNRAESKSVSLDPRDSMEWVNATLLIWEQDLLLTTALGKTTEIQKTTEIISEVKMFFHSSKNKPQNLSVLGHMVFSFNSFLFYTWEKKDSFPNHTFSTPTVVVSTQLWLDSTLFYENPWLNAVCLPAALSVWPFEFLKQLQHSATTWARWYIHPKPKQVGAQNFQFQSQLSWMSVFHHKQTLLKSVRI